MPRIGHVVQIFSGTDNESTGVKADNIYIKKLEFHLSSDRPKIHKDSFEEIFIENDASFNIHNENEVASKIHQYLKTDFQLPITTKNLNYYLEYTIHEDEIKNLKNYFSPSPGEYLPNALIHSYDLERRFMRRLEKEIDNLRLQPLETITTGVILEVLEKVTKTSKEELEACNTVQDKRDPLQATISFLENNYEVEDVKKFRTHLISEKKEFPVGGIIPKSVLEFIELQIKHTYSSAWWKDVLKLYYDRDIYIMIQYLQNLDENEMYSIATFKKFLTTRRYRFELFETDPLECYSIRNICDHRGLTSSARWDQVRRDFRIHLNKDDTLAEHLPKSLFNLYLKLRNRYISKLVVKT